jgi:sugar transferase (PEP-CTERM/EpsH1 system associated)
MGVQLDEQSPMMASETAAEIGSMSEARITSDEKDEPVGLSTVERPRDRSQRKVLLVTHRTPYPPDKGDRIRSYHLLRFLSARAQVDLATLADEPMTTESRCALEALVGRLAVVAVHRSARWGRAALSVALGRSATEGLFRSRGMTRVLQRWTASNEYDLIVVVCSSMAQYLQTMSRGSAASLVDLIDVDSQKWFDYAAASQGLKRRLYRLEGRRVRRLEQGLVGRCDQLSVVSEAEAACLRSIEPKAPVAAISNGVDLDYFRPNVAVAEEAESCVFVGALDYRPNVDAAAWFCDAVWPQVLAARPNATFTIVGRRPVEGVRRLAQLPGVCVAADVPDVRPHLWKAAVVAAPLRIARGVQNKVLEALAAGKAVIASPQALEGLSTVAGVHLQQAEAADDWARSIVALFSNAGERRRLGAAGRQFVVSRHSWDECLQPLEALLAR